MAAATSGGTICSQVESPLADLRENGAREDAEVFAMDLVDLLDVTALHEVLEKVRGRVSGTSMLLTVVRSG